MFLMKVLLLNAQVDLELPGSGDAPFSAFWVTGTTVPCPPCVKHSLHCAIFSHPGLCTHLPLWNTSLS